MGGRRFLTVVSSPIKQAVSPNEAILHRMASILSERDSGPPALDVRILPAVVKQDAKNEQRRGPARPV